jgi:O-acetyl-ADP-ribose deacetylase (regulator of RNase III)
MITLSSRIELLKGDITTLQVDAVVNAANSSLLGGGGVDGAIHRVGGPAIMEDCLKIVASQGGCKTGEAVMTTAGRLPAKFVIHTVGPVWHGGDKGEPEKLASCYINSLQLASIKDCKSIAFPNISTGIYGYPKFEAAQLAVKTVCSFLLKNNSIEKVVFVCFDEENYLFVQKQLHLAGLEI